MQSFTAHQPTTSNLRSFVVEMCRRFVEIFFVGDRRDRRTAAKDLLTNIETSISKPMNSEWSIPKFNMDLVYRYLVTWNNK
jgi:hypothetical protein